MLAPLASVRSVQAQATREEQGQAAFQRGLAAMQAGHPEEAVTAFEAAYDANALPVVLYNLGVANAALGRPHAAVVAFDKYLAAADPATDASNITSVRAELERLRRGSCVIVPTLSPVNAVVTVDGRAADPWHGQILLAPGPREIAVRADGYQTHTQRVDAVQGRFLIEVALKPEPTPPPPALAPIPVPTASATPPAAPPPASVAQPAPPTAPPPAPTPAPAAIEPEPRATEAPSSEPPGESKCAAGDWCMGPVVTGGIPALVGPGFHVRNDHFGFGLDFQITPTIELGSGSLGLYMLSGTFRVFPFGGAFFLDTGFAIYHASGSAAATDPMTGERFKAEGSTGFPGLLLGIGMLGREGFVFGIDFSALIPLASTNISPRIVQGDPTNDRAVTVRKNVTDTVNKALDALPFVPQLNLLRLGYLF